MDWAVRMPDAKRVDILLESGDLAEGEHLVCDTTRPIAEALESLLERMPEAMAGSWTYLPCHGPDPAHL